MMERYHYQGPNGMPAACGIEIIEIGQRRPIVVLTELPDNPGMSITNAAEWLASQVKSDLLPQTDPDVIRWVEHWPAAKGYPEHFDEVLFTGFRDGRYHGVGWTPLVGDLTIEDLRNGDILLPAGMTKMEARS